MIPQKMAWIATMLLLESTKHSDDSFEGRMYYKYHLRVIRAYTCYGHIELEYKLQEVETAYHYILNYSDDLGTRPLALDTLIQIVRAMGG